MDRDRLGSLRPQIVEDSRLSRSAQVILWAEAWGDLIEHMLWKGLIDPGSRTAHGLVLRAWDVAHGEPGLRLPVPCAVHVEHLLRESRRQVLAQHEEISLVLIVTAIEHTMNDVLIRGMQDQGMTPKEIKDRLFWRWDDKTNKLWNDLFAEKMDVTMRRRLSAAVRERNAFIHAKLPTETISHGEDVDVSIGVSDALIEDPYTALESLRSWRRERFFHGVDRDQVVRDLVAALVESK